MALAFIKKRNNGGAGAAQNGGVVLPVETGTAQPQSNARFLDPVLEAKIGNTEADRSDRSGPVQSK